MKIAFVGSHCVGKTTAVWHVGSALKQIGYESVEILPELARLCPLPINEEAGFSTTLWLMMEQIKTEYFMQQKKSHGKEIIILSDRSVFDNYAYGSINCPPMKDFLKTIAEAWMKVAPYDALLYFPIEWKIIDDGTRSTNQWWQMKVDNTLWAWLVSHHADKFVHVSGKTHTERCQNALEIVEKLLEGKK